MEPISVITTCLDTVPLLGKALHKALERKMRIEVQGWFADTKPIFSALVIWRGANGSLTLLDNPSIYGQFNLTFINHRTDRREFLLRARLVYKNMFLWRKKVLGSAPVKVYNVNGSDKPLENIAFEPLSAPQTFTLIADGLITHSVHKFPRKSKLFLELDFVGPIGTMRRYLKTITHDRQAVRKALSQSKGA